MFQIRSQLTSMFSSSANRSLASCAWRRSSARLAASRWRWSSSCSAVSTTEVTMPGSADDATRGADGAVADACRDLADLERELGRARERVAALVHRRRAGMRGLALPGDRASARRRRCRARRRAGAPSTRAPGPARCGARDRRRPCRAGSVRRARGRGRRRSRRARRGARSRRGRSAAAARPGRSSSPTAAEEPKSERPKRAPSSSAQLTSRTVTGGVPSLGDPPQHLGAGDDVEAAVEPAAVRDRVDVAADQDGALGLAAQRPPVVAGCVALALEREPVEQADQPDAGGVPRVRPRDALGAVRRRP